MVIEGGLENDLAICSLCSGYAGLELGIKRVFPRSRTVCFVEGEAFAVQHLIKKMEEGRLDNAPIWSNLTTFDGSKWRGKVDLITGGFPCQPFSYAGSQKGTKDERHLWPHISRIISEIRPKFIFLENVPGIIKWILPDILSDLSKMGYNASWCVIRASDAGAPHKRSRWFLWGEYTEKNSDTYFKRCYENKLETQKRKQSHVVRSCENVSNSNSFSFEESQRTDRKLSKEGGGLLPKENKREAWNFFRSRGENVSNANRSRMQRIQCKILNDQEKRREENSRKFNEDGIISRKFENHWETEPSMGRLVDGSTDWVDKLRLLGNGVVPQQAEYALRLLLKNLHSSIS